MRVFSERSMCKMINRKKYDVTRFCEFYLADISFFLLRGLRMKKAILTSSYGFSISCVFLVKEVSVT